MKIYPANLLHLKYRPDIDGLRAIAVLAVVGFHAFPELLRGGFIGVDVFFVISGFLISTILFENLEKNTFSISNFYSRRIKRIFPALLLVLVTCFVFGWFVLFPDEYKQLGKHMAGGAGFFSNILFWNESGYFDNAAEIKPLLHLWSLGIEEQFYIIWPLLLWAAWKLKFNLFLIIILVASISFYCNVKGIHTDTVATFYSPQTRFWELLFGSLLAWLTLYKFDLQNDSSESKWHRFFNNFIATSGSLLIIYGLYQISKDANFPGSLALLPTFGAVLIISAGPKAWINRKVLSNPVLVWFGLISFPLYLWHWPLLSYARIVESGDPGANIKLTLVCLSVLLAWLTYRLIEKPIRFGSNNKLKIFSLIFMMLGVGLLGYTTYNMGGFEFRNKDRQEFISYFESSFPEWKYYKTIQLSKTRRSECAFFNEEKYFKEGHLEGGVIDSKPRKKLDTSCYVKDGKHSKTVLIWGDSHAQALAPGMLSQIPPNWQVLQVASSGCTPNPDIDMPSSVSQCQQSNYFAMKTIKEVIPDVVVIAHAGGHNSEDIKKIALKLKQAGIKRILYLGATPQWTTDFPKILVRQLGLKIPVRTYAGINWDVVYNNKRLADDLKFSNLVEFVNIIDFFCNKNGCLTYTGDDIKTGITTWDYGHLTPSGSNYLAKNMLISKVTGT